VSLVSVLTWNDFSLNWLADKSAEFIQSQLHLFERKLDYVEILKDVAVSI